VIILCGTLLSIDVISFENIPKGIHSISGVIIFQLNFFEELFGIILESVWKVFCKDASLLADWINQRQLFIPIVFLSHLYDLIHTI